MADNKNTKARPNPLFDYANYTYGLSLHVVPPENYNMLMNNPNYQYTPMVDGVGTILIASGGRRNDSNFKRHPAFNEDFYFKELKFTTIVGMTTISKNTNAISMSFTITEPYGLTFINRFLEMAQNIKAKSWMQIPFLLELNFFGNTETGEIHDKIVSQTKYIPIRITNCKIKVTKDGGEYQISAVIFNHQAFSDSNVRTPAAFAVTAKTVEEFFSSDPNKAGEANGILNVNKAVAARLEALSNEAVKEQKKKNPSEARLNEIAKSNQELGQAVQSSTYLVGSYTAAINSFQKQLVKNNKTMQEYPEVYSFKFDEEIAKSSIVFPKKTAINMIPMPDPTSSQKALAEIRSNAGIQTIGFVRNRESFGINAGTSIVEVINQVMRNSRYIRDQITDPTIDVQKASDSDIQNYANKANKKIKWFKIIPIINIKDFDCIRDTYSKEIIYVVKTYEFHNTKSSTAPKSVPESALKEYHYIFTGKNDSILNFDLDFDTTFLIVATADKTKLEKTVTSTISEENLSGKAPRQKLDISVQDTMIKNTSLQMDLAAAQGGSYDAKGQAVNDLYRASLSESPGDMINIKLKIIGDPELIKQDDVFFNPINYPSKSSEIIDKNGSLLFDHYEIPVLLTFNTPTDFDQETGLAKLESATMPSVFSGMYRLIKVENEFKSGQFTQTLDLIRMFGQTKYDNLKNPNTPSQANRQPEATTIAEGKNKDQESSLKNSYKIPTRTKPSTNLLEKINQPKDENGQPIGNSYRIPSRTRVKEMMDLNDSLKNVAPTNMTNSKNN